MSLLTDPTLMQPKNIAQGYDLFTGKCERNNTDDSYGEIQTGDAWEPARQHFCGNDNPINMPIVLVIFGDKSHLDLHGSLSTLPIIFTLSCFNQESRNKDKFCIPLHFFQILAMEHFLQKTQRNLSTKAIRMSMIVFMLPFLAYNASIKMAEWQ